MIPTKYEVDVAKYARIETGKDDITLTWEEARDIFRVVVVTSEPGTLSNIKLQYWQNHWPHQRVPKGAVVGAGRTGWMAQDDWYNGKWKDADFRVLLEGTDVDAAKNVFPIAFKPINVKEFPDIKDFKAIYRRTMKLRLLFRGERQGIDRIEVYTDSIWKETEIKIEWGDNFASQDWLGHFSIYNGELIGVEPLTDNVKVDNENQISCNNKNGSIKAKLRFTYNEDINSFDKTIVTFRTTARSFSFLIDEVEAGQRIFIKDFDVLVTRLRDNVSYKTFREEWEKNHKLTVYDRIKYLPEQTYSKSWNDMPKKKSRGFMPMGCDGGRQKFAVDQNGDVFYRKNWIPRVKGKDTDRVLWDGEELRHSFGFPNVEPVMRHRIDGYLPMIYGRWEDQGIAYEQTAFVTLLGKDILSGERMEGDDPTILLARITLINLQNNPQTARLCLKSRCSIEEKLEEENGFIFATNYEPRRMRYFLDTGGKGLFKMADNLQYLIELEKNESHSIYVKVPFITLASNEEYEIAKNTDYDVEFGKVKKFWQERVAKGSQIHVPNQVLNNFYPAHLTHMLITDDREVGSNRYASRVGTFPYGVFPDESIMCISDLDRRGYKQEAEERLEMLIHYQGTVGVPATFSKVEGQYYGAGGYECGGYNKSHGWVLWGLGEHYWYHRDQEWLNRVAPSIIKACDWVISERRSTMKYDSNGKKVLEYGFLPAGSLEDVRDFGFWLATNAPTYWGFKNVAKALVDAGHPEGQRLLKEAEEFGKDLLVGFMESMILSPVVKLRDDTYVPHFPPRLYCRGRDFGWLRETLEGSLHLIRSEILEPCSEESTWIIKDFEDNLYISDRYGYSVEDFERDWFSLGGFTMQSNLFPHTIPYLWRDEPKHYLRGYFNAFTSAFYPDICALVEHALPTLADNNGVWFKPSDEAQSTYWLRLMLIYENANQLNLGMMAPREWFEHGKVIKIHRAATYFGQMGYEIRSEVDNGKITMILNPPTRNMPDEINIRFRHPQEKPVKEVMVNGKKWDEFNNEKEIIRLGKVNDKTEIIALY